MRVRHVPLAAMLLFHFGHLHGAAQKRALEGVHYNTDFHLVAGDYLNFLPVKVRD